MVALSPFRRRPEEDEWFIPYNPSKSRATSSRALAHRSLPPLPSNRAHHQKSSSLSLPRDSLSASSRSTHTRRRTISTPSSHSARVYGAPTVCDRLVLPRPSIAPLVITPPGSPEEESESFGDRVVLEGELRAKEREQWAKYAKPRTRSFGNERPRPDAPIIGRIRTEESRRRGPLRISQEHRDFRLVSAPELHRVQPVVVINRETKQPPDFSKPLPDLPSTTAEKTPAARQFIMQEHLKAKTRRAFQTPTSRSPRLDSAASPEELSDRFKGLFFRTPQEATPAHYSPRFPEK